MTLLLQLHGDLPEHFPGHERRLYVFLCRRKTCRRKEGSVRAIRSIRSKSPVSSPAEAVSKVQKEPLGQPSQDTRVHKNIGNSIFGIKSISEISSATNPFASSAGISGSPFLSEVAPSPFVQRVEGSSEMETDVVDAPKITISDLPMTPAQQVKISLPSKPLDPSTHVKPWPAKAELPPAYPTYYLDADYETLETQIQPITSFPESTVDETSETSFTRLTTKEDFETFESTIDRTFQRFADRLGQNPLQVLRYEFKGSPLLYSQTDVVGRRLSFCQSSAQAINGKVLMASRSDYSGMPPCANCGCARVFEFQLTPQAICELEVHETGLEGMEWGTIIMGVCQEDCIADGVEAGQVGYQEEWVGVQWEEARGTTR